MTPDEITCLDGPGLTALAFSLGLAPRGTVANHEPFREPYTCHAGYLGGSPWLPHVCLDQAHAVFRKLRGLGFCAQTHFYPSEPPTGRVSAWRYPGGQAVVVHFGADVEGECAALLRVACLAVARLGQNAYS